MKCRICGNDSGPYLYCKDCDSHGHDEDTPDGPQESEDYEERMESHGK